MDGKVCTKCNRWKEYSEFPKRKEMKDGYRNDCKECRKHYYQEFRKENEVYYNEYRKKNHDKIIGSNKKYYDTKKGRESSYRNNLKRRSNENYVEFTTHQREEILKRDNYTCQCCRIKVHDRSTGDWNTPDKAHIDHIFPISKGGRSEPDNLQVLCRTCNLSKKDRLVM